MKNLSFFLGIVVIMWGSIAHAQEENTFTISALDFGGLTACSLGTGINGSATLDGMDQCIVKLSSEEAGSADVSATLIIESQHYCTYNVEISDNAIQNVTPTSETSITCTKVTWESSSNQTLTFSKK